MSTNKKEAAQRYRRIFFLSDDDVQRLQAAGEQIDQQQEPAFMEFYAWMDYQQELKLLFTEEVIDAMAGFERNMWLDLIMARVDSDFIERQRSIGQFMQRQGVPFETYLMVLVAFHDIVEKAFARVGLACADLVRAFRKVAGINICLVIDLYNEGINETLKEQHAALSEMSTPVAKLWDGILFLPLVGIVDSKRAQLVMSAMLQKIAETQTKTFVLDISGIVVLDTAVANHLIKMTKAVRLMGSRCIISGISPAVAQTLVELGVQTDEMTTTGNLQDALSLAFQLTGKRIMDV